MCRTPSPVDVESIAVMVPTGDDDHVVLFDGVYQAMFIVDASGPESREFAFERLGFADAFERQSQDVLEDLIDSLRKLAIVLHEPLIIVPRRRCEREVHGRLTWGSVREWSPGRRRLPRSNA